MYLVTKMKQHTVLMHQNKLLAKKNVLIYYFYWILNSYYVLIKYFNKFMTKKTKHHGKKNFVDNICNNFLVQEY